MKKSIIQIALSILFLVCGCTQQTKTEVAMGQDTLQQSLDAVFDSLMVAEPAPSDSAFSMKMDRMPSKLGYPDSIRIVEPRPTK